MPHGSNQDMCEYRYTIVTRNQNISEIFVENNSVSSKAEHRDFSVVDRCFEFSATCLNHVCSYRKYYRFRVAGHKYFFSIFCKDFPKTSDGRIQNASKDPAVFSFFNRNGSDLYISKSDVVDTGWKLFCSTTM